VTAAGGVPEGSNRQVRLAAHPVGMVGEEHFSFDETAVPEPAEGEALARNLYLSLDPAIRGWMTGVDTYVPGIQVGDVMRAGGLTEVVESRTPAFSPGDLVYSMLEWSDYTIVQPGLGMVVPRQEPLTAYLSVYGATGLTAYFGVHDVAPPVAGETFVVSGGAGAVGSVAGQIAKIIGCRVVGIAGTAEKCRWMTADLGFDAAVDYKTEDVEQRLRQLCPDGIDVYFDNVGGDILEAVLGQINLRARIALCGAISTYNDTEPRPGPRNLFNLIVQRGRMEGFIVLDYQDRFLDAILQLGQWVAEGRIKYAEEIVDGLEAAPGALRRLFTGENTGKLIVNVHD